MKCSECSNQRWQIFVAKWRDDRLDKTWRPLDRAAWSFMAPPTIAAGLATKTIRACPACNGDAFAPWSRRWTDDGGGQVAGQVAQDGNPF
jgi:hypothetical protein